MSGSANVIGAGLMGGSVGMALRAAGWSVSISDRDDSAAKEAVCVGAADSVGLDPAAELTVVAVPVGSVPEAVESALDRTTGLVTDVGSTKADICGAITDPRFVGGHPMAGSEQDGISGSDPEIFRSAMWVLTPVDSTAEATFARVSNVIRSFGSEVIALSPEVHDELVAQVSHVPHLTAASLMMLADETSVEHRALLRLAAGGFRDMTRISSGRPSIWPDICVANRTAIVESLGRLIGALEDVRDTVSAGDRDRLLDFLNGARQARLNLPTGFRVADGLAEVAVPIPDRPGEIAAIATLASELDVNILDLDISHSGEGGRGIMLIVVDSEMSERLVGGLMARSYRPNVRTLD